MLFIELCTHSKQIIPVSNNERGSVQNTQDCRKLLHLRRIFFVTRRLFLFTQNNCKIPFTPDKLNRIEIQVYGISFIWFLSVHENKERSPKSAITQNPLNYTLSVYSFTTVALNVQNVKNLSRMKCFKHFIE